ncbi:PXA domain-domain-containing protein [Yarrowia lipolytica]|nr:PXA domain-domain-containing protein [Yarrowia lipolytica]
MEDAPPFIYLYHEMSDSIEPRPQQKGQFLWILGGLVLVVALRGILFSSLALGVLLGFLSAVVLVLALLYVHNGNSTNGAYSTGIEHPSGSFKPIGFTLPEVWERHVTELTTEPAELPPIEPNSFIISDSLDTLIEYIVRDFVMAWFGNVCKTDHMFGYEIDTALRSITKELSLRLKRIDLAVFLILKLLPIVKTHFTDFVTADKTVRERAGTKLTESHEFNAAVATEFLQNVSEHPHPAVAVKDMDNEARGKEWLRGVSQRLLLRTLPVEERNVKLVVLLLREILACTVLFPVVSGTLSDPDTWNQLLVKFVEPSLEDKRNVQQVRDAWDKHSAAQTTSPAPSEGSATPKKRPIKLSPSASQQDFERFIRKIKAIDTAQEAKQLRYNISVQLQRLDKEASGSYESGLYSGRLREAQSILDAKLQDFGIASSASAPSSAPSSASVSEKPHNLNAFEKFLRNTTATASSTISSSSSMSEEHIVAALRHDKLKYGLSDVLNDPSCLQWFMEFADQRSRMVLLQFWLTVNSIKDPLEEFAGKTQEGLDLDNEDQSDDEDIPVGVTASQLKQSRDDVETIYEMYFQGHMEGPQLVVDPRSFNDVRTFVESKHPTMDQYRQARKGILRTQHAAFQKLEKCDLEDFKKSDLFSKFLAIQPTEQQIAAYHKKKKKWGVTDMFKKLDTPKRKPVSSSASSSHHDTKSSPEKRDRSSHNDHQDKRNSHHQSDGANTSLLDGVDVEANDDFNSHYSSLDQSQKPAADKSLIDLNDTQSQSEKVAPQSAPLISLDDEATSRPVTPPPQQPTSAGESQLSQSEAVQAALKSIMDSPSGTRDPLFDDDDDFGIFGSKRSGSKLLEEGSRPGSKLFEGSRPASKLFDDSDYDESDVEKVQSSVVASLSQSLDEDQIKALDTADAIPPEEESFSLHFASPGDLGLTEAIKTLTIDIEKLKGQVKVLEPLLRKAELTNNTNEIRILSKSVSSLQREINNKEMQRQQYIVQETDNSLYGRSAIAIQNAVSSHDKMGNEFVVYLVEVTRHGDDSDKEGASSATWIVARRYSHFLQLHQHLIRSFPYISRIPFPKKKVVIKFNQKSFVDSRKVQLEAYLRELLKMPEICNSVAYRAFLSSHNFVTKYKSVAEEGLRADADNRVSLRDELRVATNFFANDGLLSDSLNSNMIGANGSNNSSASLASESTQTATASAVSGTSNSTATTAAPKKESKISNATFVKPISDLFVKLFRLDRGDGLILRGRAIVIVIQQLLGGTIERRVRDSLNSHVANEQSVSNYLQLLLNNVWPDGKFRSAGEVRSVHEKTSTRHHAKTLLEAAIVDFSSKVVGTSNSKYAAHNLFMMLQNPILNRQLVLLILDELVNELLSEH